MNIIEAFQKELEKEAITTRKMIERIPEGKFDWQPHPKSMTIKRLANHIIELPGWIGMTLHTDGLDFSENPYQPTEYTDTKSLLEHFEEVLESGRRDLENAELDKLEEMWTLSEGEVVYSTETKWEVLRMSISQIIHHRAQLGVYLRLLEVPIPGSYGPSADEGNG
ncbi:DinB family protein [Pararhodonellum marinum]|uniref:DinB family protein n=1 Tax=Pararhodonellum marinum TaxID=2755358 RepID=UPI0018904F68|nr:DinB family protein [Pararhodonellum marinum]